MIDVQKIYDLQAPALAVYTDLSETQLYHYYEPAPGVFIAESPKVIRRALAAGYEPISVLMDEQQYRRGAEGLIAQLRDHTNGDTYDRPPGDLPVYVGEESVLRELTGFPLTRGCLCAMHRRTLPGWEPILKSAERICIMENVVNPTNVGAIFRSAAALGMDAVLLTHGCCDPLYRRAVRVSMGTVFQVPWTFLDGVGGSGTPKWPQEAIRQLRGAGFTTMAMALTDRSVPIDDPALSRCKKTAIVLGTEGEGLMEQTINCCDYTVRIPMSGGVDSLNVAAASAVAFWQLRAGR